jgi:hypothetical protein
MYLFLPLLRGSGVSRKTKRPYSAMKIWIPRVGAPYTLVWIGSRIFRN